MFNLQDLWTSIVRTIVPVIVGAVSSWLATKGIALDPQLMSSLSIVLTALFSTLYYILARMLELKYPKLGWLLGSPKKPEYTK